jgi:hypothetical protein
MTRPSDRPLVLRADDVRRFLRQVGIVSNAWRPARTDLGDRRDDEIDPQASLRDHNAGPCERGHGRVADAGRPCARGPPAQVPALGPVQRRAEPLEDNRDIGWRGLLGRSDQGQLIDGSLSLDTCRVWWMGGDGSLGPLRDSRTATSWRASRGPEPLLHS